MARSRRAVFVCCDGLGRDWVRADTTPVLHEIAGDSLWCAEHSAVFPSVTRVSAASVSTGCFPARHGLHGNRMGLIEGDRIVVRDVGRPDFRTHMRRATGGTLLVPSLAERVAGAGGFIAFSNCLAGRRLFPRSGAFRLCLSPRRVVCAGRRPHRSADALDVSHDAAGDWAMTQRFCREVLGDRRPAVAFLWLCDPDHTLHGVPLGSPAHADALRGAERCVAEVLRTVARLRAEGDEILLLIGSDHGQETIGDGVEPRRLAGGARPGGRAGGRRRGDGGAGHCGVALRHGARPRRTAGRPRRDATGAVGG